ncbi:MAG: ATP-binding protein [Myxococcaceae bacterium]
MGPPEIDRSQQSRELSAMLRQHREEILTQWATLCRENAKARTLTDEQLLDHLPKLLDKLASGVEAVSEGRDSAVPVKESQAHALHRLDAGFDLPDITQEYALLRRVVFSILSRHAPQLVVGGYDVVGNAIDASVAESVEYYVRVRHRTLEALDQVAQVVTGPGELDAILQKLLMVTMQTIPSVDAVTVLLKQGETLTVKAALGVMAERDRSFTLMVGEGFAGTIAATRQPMFLPAAHVAPIVRSGFIKERNIKAMYGVPMIRGAEVVGVAHMASLTAREFADEDLLLFRTVAERATGVVVQAELMAKERAARSFLETVIGSIGEGVVVTDLQGQVILASEGAARIFNTTREALKMRAEVFEERFRPRTPDGSPKRPAVLDALGGEVVAPEERIVTDAKGQDHYVLVSSAPVRTDGAISGAVVLFVDLSERRQLEDQLRRMVAFRERLMGIVGHDLRSPLYAITLANQLMLAHEDAPAWARTSALRVKRSADRMSRMVSDLLDFTRIQSSSTLPLERKRVDLCELVRDTVDELSIAYPGRLSLRLDCAKSYGLWDGDRLVQVVTNLVNNAIEHGGASTPVEVAVSEEPDRVKLQVTNQGETISPELMPLLFDPFRRATAEARGGGLGLGLYIVSEVARAHHGAVQGESKDGVTTFTVTLPRAG